MVKLDKKKEVLGHKLIKKEKYWGKIGNRR